MDAEALRTHCLGLPGAVEERPFGPDALVLKVSGKMFALIGDRADPPTVSLKCEPELALVLRETHPAVAPGYHLNKRHWNTVTLDGTVADDEVLGWVDDSYDLVVDGLPRKQQEALRESPNRNA